MSIYDYEEAFEAWDLTTSPMRKAIDRWMALYYEQPSTETGDPCQKIPYTVVNKLVKTIFGEYQAQCRDEQGQKLLTVLNSLKRDAMQQMLIGGECYLKPCVGQDGFSFTLIPRTNLLIFNRDGNGNPTDVGTVEKSLLGNAWYTLLERRRLDEDGYLTIENRLYRSLNPDRLGSPADLHGHPRYAQLTKRFTYPEPMDSAGLVRLRTPMLNCVDGSPDGVAVYAAAEGLIRNIDENEAQMNGEFSRGESRILASADMLSGEGLTDHVFVGLDEDPEQVGITVFSPALREQSYLARKREYLRNVESLIGLKRGMLSDANAEKWTATEISSSSAEYNLTVMELQKVWQQAVHSAVVLCAKLAEVYHLPAIRDTQVLMDWGNGILYDEDKTWQQYLQMTEKGLICPEIALGWRFHMPWDTPEQREKIRNLFMPEKNT